MLGLVLPAISQTSMPLFTRSPLPLPAKYEKDIRRAQRLELSNQTMQKIYQEEPESFKVTLPLPGSSQKELTFHKAKVVSDDFVVLTSDGQRLRGKKYAGVHYQIRSGDQAEKVGVLSFSEQGVMGIFSDDQGNWNIGELPKTGGDYVVFSERDLNHKSDFHCETEDHPEEDDVKKGKGLGWDKSVQTSGTCRTVKMYFETDFKMYQDNGSSTANVTAKVNGMFNAVKQLYLNEQIDIELDQLLVWTTTDPFATQTSAFNYLFNFASARLSITQHLGHLLSTRPTSFGGIAYINVLCNNNARYGFSNIYNSYNDLPVYSWSVYCITHEIGHNFGSRHTHWCGWQLTGSTIGRIDSCYAGESVSGAINCTSTTKSNLNGTIMSYCHLMGAINFNRGFGNLPGGIIRTGFNSAACVTGAPVPAFSVNGTRLICEGGNIQLNMNTAVTGTTCSWTGPNGFSSSQTNPQITNASAAANGDYLCTLSKGGCTTDAKTVSVVVNGITSAPINETFEGSFLPAGWRIANPNKDRTFVQNTTVGGFGSSTKCMSFDNYNMPFIGGRRDTIFAPVVNLAGQTGTSLKFDVAHAWNTVTFDTLSVLVSIDCGRTFTRVFRKTGTALATAPNTFNAFIPTASQWRKETIDLAAYNGQGAVQIAFINVSGGTNFLYLDNINLSTTGGSGVPSINLQALSQTSYCPGASFSFGFTPTGTFNSGNNFTVQLSNGSGSFASPTTIGSGTTSPITVTIPAGTTTGSNYQIRVVASNPNVTSSTTTGFSISPLTVSAGTDRSVCANAAALTLTATPAGGTWSGSGVTAGGVFTPTTGLVGNQTLTYSVNSAGCSGNDQLIVTVKALPAVNAGSNSTTCSGNAPFVLGGFSPAGGTWSGSGVSGTGTFTPTTGLIGTHTLTYSVTSNGCTATDTRTITVNASVVASAGTPQTVCSNGNSISFTGSPTGGTWSGSGITAGGVFTPGSGLIGTQTLTYTVSGTCGSSNSTTATVVAAPTVNAGIDRDFCANDPAFTIVQGSPAGGTWSGNGVSGGIFTPSTSNLGSNTLTYSFTQNGCTSTSTVDYTVNNVPAPSAGPALTSCINSAPFSLTGNPAGGTWSGNGVNGSGVFSPGPGLLGTQTITYTLTQNGCTGSATTTIQVFDLPVVDAQDEETTNSGAADLVLTGSPAGGTWSGTGVSPTGVFSPSGSGPGTFTLTYTVTQNGCQGSDNMTITVLPSASVSAGSDQALCESSAPVVLSGTPTGGTWSGTGVTADGTFTPSAGLIGIQTLTYTVSGLGSDEVSITVSTAPVVDAGTNQTVCSNATDFTLSGASPVGGTWTGTGISSSGLVDVSQLVSGGSTFTYTYSQGGCSATDVITITPSAPPTVNAGPNASICKNAVPRQLNGSPAGGTWSGSGVSASGLFDPSTVSNGAKTLTYTVEGSIPGCSGSDQMVMTVFNIPNVSAGADRSVCANGTAIQLTGSPSGGTWTGAGVSGTGLFTPGQSLVGIQTLTYSVTQSGCTNNSTLNVTVNSLPNVSAGGNQNICSNTPSFSLSGASPAGGTWSGPSFVNGSGFCTAPFAVGTYSITYTATENGCTASNTLSLSVKATPVVDAGNNRSVCSNGTNLTLNGFSPAGGVWSGNGVSASGIFSPSAALVGNQVLVYTVTQDGCSGTDQLTVNVKSIPAITTGQNETACASGASFKINGYSPRGGKWTGPGIVQDSIFVPNASLIGTQTLTYSVTRNGCSNSMQKTVTVSAPTTINPGTHTSQICANSGPVAFAGFSPAGGIWKGPGMAPNGLLTPNSGLTGNQTYTYRLDLNGCRDSVQVQTLVNAVPVVNAGPDATACATGASVPLTGAIPAGGIWSGPGVTDTGIFSPSSVSPGNISLTYSVTENGCTGTDNININVTAAPAVSGGPDRNICKNSIPVVLSGNPVGGTWSGTGVSAGGIFTPTSSMSGNITLNYSINQGGCTGTDQVIVSITNALSINAGPDQSICDNAGPVNLSGFSPAGGTWSGPGVTSTGTFEPDTMLLGTQTLTYQVTQGSCTVRDARVITVKSAPDVSAGPDLTICSNASPATINGFSPAGGTWSGSVVNSSGLVTPVSSGIVAITYSVTSNGCTGTDTRVITFVPAPAVDAGPGQTICGLTGNIQMEGFFPSNGIWSGPGINQQGVFNPTGSQLGTEVTVTYAATQNGCTASSTKTLFVVNIPGQIAISSASAQSCEGSVLPLDLNLTNTGAFTIAWLRNGAAISGANSTIFNATQSGVYRAEVKASSCQVISPDKTITFQVVPGSPTISQAGNILQSSASTGNQWQRNGQNIPGATNQTFQPTQSGIYTVVVTSLSCTSDPSNAIPVTFTDVEETLTAKTDVLIFPNPSNGRFQVRFTGNPGIQVPVRILDASGRQVWTTELTSENQSEEGLTLEPSGMASGVYWIRFTFPNQTLIKKLIIK